MDPTFTDRREPYAPWHRRFWSPSAALVETSDGPPRWLTALLGVALGALLVYPVHVPYQNPDQDLPIQQALTELVRGGWSPVSLAYPSGLTNLLRAGCELLVLGAGGLGMSLERSELLVASHVSPEPFRMALRLLAMLAGVVALALTHALGRRIGDRWMGLFAMVILGTSPTFVREHHFGMQDPFASTATLACLLACTAYVQRPSTRSIAVAGGAAALAFCFKQNGAFAGVPLVIALALGERRGAQRTLDAGAAAAAGLAILMLVSPAVLLEWSRFLRHVQLIGAVVFNAAESASSGSSYGLATVLWIGVGPLALLLAGAGAARAVARRERALAPLIGFVLVYGAVAARSMVVLSRYALPLAPPLAALAAYAVLPAWGIGMRSALVGFVAALRVPAVIAFVLLVAQEDSRVGAARWLRANVSPEDRVLLPGGPLYVGYVGPTLRPRWVASPALAPDVRAEIERRMPPQFPPLWRFERTLRASESEDALPPRLAGSIVVTVEHDAEPFAIGMTAPRLVRMLEKNATLVADFPIVRDGGAGADTDTARVYEPRDMNFAPVAGAVSLLRPGPRIRIWRLPQGSS